MEFSLWFGLEDEEDDDGLVLPLLAFVGAADGVPVREGGRAD